jgi:SAM-dependent methyltransferase
MHPMTLEEVARVYDARASITFDGSTNREETESALNLLQRIEPALDRCILDVGCGTGWLLAAAHDAGYRRVFGVDISTMCLRKAAELCRATSAIFILGTVDSLPPCAFHIVTAFNACLGCFGPVGDQAFINGIHHALAPGGKMVLSYVGPNGARSRVGDYKVSYASDGENVISSVRLDLAGQWLIVNQMIGGRPICQERIAILTRTKLESMLRQAGFDGVQHINPIERVGLYPFVDVVIATKPT